MDTPSKEVSLLRSRLKAMAEHADRVPYLDLTEGKEYNDIVNELGFELELDLRRFLLVDNDRIDLQRPKTVGSHGQPRRSVKPEHSANWWFQSSRFLGKASGVLGFLSEMYDQESVAIAHEKGGDSHFYYGDNYNIANRSKDFQQTVTVGVPAEQLATLVNRLSSAGVLEDAIGQLLHAIEEDTREAGRPSAGKRVWGWLGDITRGVAGNLVAAAGMQLDPSQVVEVTRVLGEFASSLP